MSDNRSINMSDNRSINMNGNGNYNQRIEGNYHQGDYYAGEKQSTQANVAREIQQLLQQLQQYEPADNNPDRMRVAAQAIQEIETNPSLKQRVISAVEKGGLAAFERAIDNPAGAFVVAAIKDWQEVE